MTDQQIKEKAIKDLKELQEKFKDFPDSGPICGKLLVDKSKSTEQVSEGVPLM